MRARGPRGRTSPPARRADRLWARTPRQRARGRHRPTPFRVTSEPRHVSCCHRPGTRASCAGRGLFPGKQGAFPNRQELETSHGKPILNSCVGPEAYLVASSAPLPHTALSRVPEVCRVGGDQGVTMEPDLAHHEAPCPRAPCSRRACPAGSWHASLQGGLYHVPRCRPWPHAEVPHQHENSAPRRLGVPA